MRRSLVLWARNGVLTRPRLISIHNATFYKEHPNAVGSDATANPPLFPNLNFELSATPLQDVGKPTRRDEHWAVISSGGGTTFLEILRGSYLSIPPNARTFPYLASDEIDQKDHRLRTPSRAIQYVGFNAGKGQGIGGGVRGAYLSARYESRREETDWTLLQYLKGETELNPAEDVERPQSDTTLLDTVIKDLRLQKLLSMPVSNLSNGQTRRSRIAKALLGKPELLLLDEPFMGLDPPTLVTLSPMLRDLAYNSTPLLLLALRPQDPIPYWITHLAILGNHNTVAIQGRKEQVLFSLHRWIDVATGGSGRRMIGLEKRMAKAMTKSYGQPLFGVGNSLNENGISQYSAYNQIMEVFPSFLDEWGGLREDSLSSEDQLRWRRASDKPKDERDAKDLLILTTTLPQGIDTSSSSSSPEMDHAASDDTSRQEEDKERLGDPLIELQSVVVKYGDKVVLGYPPPQPGYKEPGLNLTIYQGTRLALLGPNGSGKTTFLSLLTSDHPQSYSLPIKFFGRTRLPSIGQPGLSLWEIQSRIGHSSPEIHAFFPKRLNVRQVLESAWSETYSSKPKLSYRRDELVNAFLRWWEPELRQNKPGVGTRPRPYTRTDDGDIKVMFEESYPPFPEWGYPVEHVPGYKTYEDLEWAEDSYNHSFGVLPFGTQRLLLLLRAIIKEPDIIILDEAFSGLSAATRDKAMAWLQYGETKFLQHSPNSPSNTWSEVINKRLDVIRVMHKLNIELKEVLRNRMLTGTYAKLRTISSADLVKLGEEVRNDPKVSELSDYRFHGLSPQQALVVVSHVKEEIPPMIDEYVRLPGEEEVAETGRGIEMGHCGSGFIQTPEGWNQVWGFSDKIV